MHATGTDFAALDDDLRLVTLPDVARFLSVSRGSLYDLLTTGQLASVHIGRSRRIPMGELRRYIRGRIERPMESLRSPSGTLSDQLPFGAIVEHRVIADKRQASPDGGCRYL